MKKFILPLLVFVCVGFSQGKGAPTLDPKTGLPISDKYKEPTIAELLADVLQGANPRESVGFTITFVRSGAGWPEFRDIEKLVKLRADQRTRYLLGLDSPLVKSLKRKFELGLKRNKFDLQRIEDSTGPTGFSSVFLSIKATKASKNTPERVIPYQWKIRIARSVSTWDGKHKIKSAPEWLITEGVAGGEERLKSKVEDAFDKIFLAYLELPEPKK